MLACSAAAAALLGVAWLIGRSEVDPAIPSPIVYQVDRSDFELAVTERGEIESAGEVEIRSEVKTRNQPGLAILRVVPEGAEVDAGDFLVELDSSALKEERTLQQIAVNTAEAAVVEARNLYETARIAKREYLEGTFVQEMETLESELFVAEENLSRAAEYLKYSKRLAAKGYVNDLQLQADEFAVEKARKEADAARTKLRVLEKFTREKMLKQLESDIVISKAKWDAQANSLRLEQGKLRELDDQVAKCVISSPRHGVVKYAHERDSRGNDDFIVEEGALVRERQVILTLPDPSRMQVEVKINESLVRFVERGMPAAVEPIGEDALVLRGVVERVNEYAEPSGWRKGYVKEYKALIRIDDTPVSLKNGMTASVTIRSIFQPDALQVPVQSLYAHGGATYCFVQQDGGRIEARRVDTGPTNDRFQVIDRGLTRGEVVVVNPRAVAANVELPESGTRGRQAPDVSRTDQPGPGPAGVAPAAKVAAYAPATPARR